jgi:hypothetical protein
MMLLELCLAVPLAVCSPVNADIVQVNVEVNKADPMDVIARCKYHNI